MVLQGPKIRTGSFVEGAIEIQEGKQYQLTNDPVRHHHHHDSQRQECTGGGGGGSGVLAVALRMRACGVHAVLLHDGGGGSGVEAEGHVGQVLRRLPRTHHLLQARQYPPPTSPYYLPPLSDLLRLLFMGVCWFVRATW